MNNLVVKENEILLMRYTELIRISACGNNAIRFQSFPDCQVIDENYTLMPQKAEAVIDEFVAFVRAGSDVINCFE